MKARYSRLDVDALEFEDLNWVLEYWRGLCSGRSLPRWQDVDLAVFPGEVLPRVCVIDVASDPLDFLYRFWGTSISDMHHYDLTQSSVRELTPEDYARCIWDQYAAVREAAAPVAFLTEVPLEYGRFTFYAAVRMPLAGDGDSIDHVLSAETYGKERDELKALFEKLRPEQNSENT